MSWDEAKYHIARECRQLEQRLLDLGFVGAHITPTGDSQCVLMHVEDLSALVTLATRSAGAHSSN